MVWIQVPYTRWTFLHKFVVRLQRLFEKTNINENKADNVTFKKTDSCHIRFGIIRDDSIKGKYPSVHKKTKRAF